MRNLTVLAPLHLQERKKIIVVTLNFLEMMLLSFYNSYIERSTTLEIKRMVKKGSFLLFVYIKSLYKQRRRLQIRSIKSCFPTFKSLFLSA
jgi:hypothetical protein